MPDPNISPQEFLEQFPCQTCGLKYSQADHIGQDIAPARGDIEQHLYQPRVPTNSDIWRKLRP